MSTGVRIGSHLSIRGGYYRAAKTAWELGARAFQYFPKNPRSLHIKSWNEADASKCALFCSEKGISSIAHSPYPVNPAIGFTKGKELYQLTVQSLQNDLMIAEACGSAGIVVHFGHLKGEDPLEGYRNIIQCLNDTLVNWKGKAKILLENQAGNHGAMGRNLEELVSVRSLSNVQDSIGFCLDTCHAFAAGLWDPSRTDELLETGEKLGYWEQLVAVHLNDSKYPYNSGQDRHERIGHGHIGEEALRGLITSPELIGKIVVLETEAGEDGSHREEIANILTW